MTDPVEFTAEDLDLLPHLLQVVVRSGGEDGTPAGGFVAAMRLVEKRGGVRIYLPHAAADDHELVPIVGLRGFKALQEAYPGEHPVVPKAQRALVVLRNRRMHRERASMSVRDLALRYQLDRRRIQQVMAEGCGQVPGDQADLFG